MQPVSKSTIIKMREVYENTIRKTSTENLKKRFPGNPLIEEALSAWVSRNELEALLTDNNADGLRLYFGCHHESTNKDPQLDYNGLHNIILVATKDKVNPENPTNENSEDQLADTDQLTDTNQKASSLKEMTTQDYTGSGGDMMPLCPPNCPK